MAQEDIERALFLLLPLSALIYLSTPIIPTLALARKHEVLLAIIFCAAGYVLPPLVAFQIVDDPPWIEIGDLHSLVLDSVLINRIHKERER